jgi:hypothetical protein
VSRARFIYGSEVNEQDILLISSSVLFFGSTITPIQIFGERSRSLLNVDSHSGYALALGGLFAYKNASGKK